MRLRYIIHHILTGLSLLLVGLGTSSLQASNSLGLADIATIPAYIVDSQSYNLSFYVVNNDPVAYLTDNVSIHMQVDGGPPFLLSAGKAPDADVAPGDSFLISIPDYQFPAPLFRGVTVTHDIIVWPMRVGASDIDSTWGEVAFEHTDAMSSDALGLVSPLGLPESVVYGETYDLTFEIVNADPVHHLYHPVSLLYTIGGEGPFVWIDAYELVEPLAPGEQLSLGLDDYSFPTERHGGATVTHDIIVWPMALYVSDPHEVNLTMTFHPFQIAFEDLPSTNPAPLITDFQISPKGHSGNDVNVSWTTGHEAQGGMFIVQESGTSQPPKPILVTQNYGNPELGADYQFVLPRPSLEGGVYDLVYATNGSYFQLGTANLAPHTGEALVISENPLTTNSFIKIWADTPEKVSLEVFDQSGKTVLNHHMQ
ncbi:MAG: hypothetical protein AAFV07_03765, partial [Bacteroidota bacterium]